MGKPQIIGYNRTNRSGANRPGNFALDQTYLLEEADRHHVRDPMRNASTRVNNSSIGSENLLVQALDTWQERQRRARTSYQRATRAPGHKQGLTRLPWITWAILLCTCAFWGLTAYQVALSAGAHTFTDILASVLNNSEDATVLIAFGAKYNTAIEAGQYWRLITPMFLHANLLHVGLNMLNFLFLGLVVERIFGHLRFALIYLLTGVISILASVWFAPQEISVGASGAIFGLVGAYSAFVLLHRQAFRWGGLPALAWLILVIGLNLGVGFVIPNVDNYAHIGGLLSGCLLGWFFTPFYTITIQDREPILVDTHSLARRWPLAFLMIVLTVLIAIIALHFVGG